MNKIQKLKIAMGFLPNQQIRTTILNQLSGIVSGSRNMCKLAREKVTSPFI